MPGLLGMVIVIFGFGIVLGFLAGGLLFGVVL